jgi:hypothetical protein
MATDANDKAHGSDQMVIVDARTESIPSALAQMRYMFLQTTANSGASARTGCDINT